MSYRMGNVPADPKDIPEFLQQELRRLQEQWNSPLEFLPLVQLHKAPAKPRDGVYLADGSDWEPLGLGTGGGFFGYMDGTWVKLNN